MILLYPEDGQVLRHNQVECELIHEQGLFFLAYCEQAILFGGGNVRAFRRHLE